MQPDEDELLERLFRSEYRALRYHAYRFLGNYDLAETAVQEAFVIACRKIDALMKSPNPEGWLMETVKNVARNLSRTHQNYRDLVISVEEADAAALATEDKSPLLLEDACGSLVSREEFLLFRRVTLEEESYSTAAERLNISVWACRKRVQRTAERLKARLSASEKNNLEAVQNRTAVYMIQARGDEA